MDTRVAIKKAEELAYSKIAERCKYDLFFLCKYVLGYADMDEFVHGPVCAAWRRVIFWDKPDLIRDLEFPSDYGRTDEMGLPSEEEKTMFYDSLEPFIPGFERDEESDNELIHKDKLLDDLNQLLMLLPRGTFKTSVITVGGPCQYFLHYSEHRILLDSETSTNTSGFLGEIKGHFEGNDDYRAVFYSVWGIMPDANSKDKSTRWHNSAVDLACRKKARKEPSIDTGGVDTTKNSRHYDLIIFDDLHSEINTKTKEQIDKVKDHWKLAYSLLDPGRPAVVIGTRWTHTDLYQEIIDEHAGDFNIITRQARSDDGALFFPEKLTAVFLDKQRERQGGYIFSCNPGEAPVLMADWSTKRIDQIRVGDEIIGFEISNGTGKNKLVKTTVTEINSRVAEVQKVTLDSGRTVRCTPDHNWYTGRNDTTHKPYRPVVIGSKMLQVVDTDYSISIEEKIDYAYLAGMVDGEGACKFGSISITQSPTHNPAVFNRIRENLQALKLPYTEYKENFVINGGRQSKFNLLRYGKPAKRHQIIKTLWNNPGMAVKRKDKVISIQSDGQERVYALTTTTGNYICWGYMSKNCQYMNNPVDSDTAKFRREWFVKKRWVEVDGIPINWYLTIDPGGDGKKSDYAAFVISGMDYQNNLYVRYIVRGKMSNGQIVLMTFQLFRKFHPRMVVVEALAGAGSAIERTYKDKQKELGEWLPIRYIKHRVKEKKERIVALAPKYEFGHVFHIAECPQLTFLEDELATFPTAKYDDVSDAFATVLEVATPPLRNAVQRESSMKRKALFKKLNAPRSPMVGY